MPLVIGLGILLSARTSRPLVKTLFYDEGLLNREKISEILARENKWAEFDLILRQASAHFTISFLVSSILHFVLARMVLKSPSGTEAFNQELGRLTALKWPVTALPAMILTAGAMWIMIRRLSKLTGLDYNSLFEEQNT